MSGRSKTRNPIIVSRWTFWVEQLMARLGRFARYTGVAPSWRLPYLSHSRSFLHERTLFSHLILQPRISLSINSGHLWNIAVRNVHARQQTTLNSFVNTTATGSSMGNRSVMLTTRTLMQLLSRRPRQSIDTTKLCEPHPTISEPITRSRNERFGVDLHLRSLIKRQDEMTDVVRKLTRRTQRRHELSEFSELRQSMALRKTPPTHSGSRAPVETTVELTSLGRPNRLPSFPELNMPAINVEEIANQVIKQIDRRVIARRERLGQV